MSRGGGGTNSFGSTPFRGDGSSPTTVPGSFELNILPLTSRDQFKPYPLMAGAKLICVNCVATGYWLLRQINRLRGRRG